MAPQTVIVTVRYSKIGTQPPIYLAGSFSEWQPEEMQYTTGESNEHDFFKQVEVEPGTEYQYKFRIGSGDWWTLCEDAPTVTDDLGNKNNLLFVPKADDTTAKSESSNSMKEYRATVSKLAMDKEDTPSVEETMGTRETDDTLFADEIVPDTNTGTQDMDTNVKELQDIQGNDTKPESVGVTVGGIIEPHATPAIAEKSESEHIEEVKHTKELQDIRRTDTSATRIEEEQVIEPTPTPLMDFKKIHDLDDVDSQNVSDNELQEDKAIAPPALVVDKAEEDKAGNPQEPIVEDSTVEANQGNPSLEATTHELASSDYLTPQTATENTSRVGTLTPDLASVAAEVADIAATLDREEPTPPVSDEEAGRTGYRRMSRTPIPQVALTAAEVADSAAIIDKDVDTEEQKEPVECIRPFDIDDGPLPDTPPNERAPRFSHECGSPPDHESPCRHDEIDPFEGMIPEVHEEPDLNDPSMKMFPTDRAEIMEHLRRMQQRLPADEVKLGLALPSPVIGPNGRPDRLNLPTVSPIVLTNRSPSLDSIPEQNDEERGVLEPSVIKLNDEDQPHTNGTTVPKDEIHAIIGQSQKENAASLSEPATKPRDLVGSMDGDKESSQSVEFEPESTKAPAAKHRTEDSIDGVCGQGSHAVPSPITPLIVGDRQLGQEDGNVQELSRSLGPSLGPSITLQPATPAPGINRQLGEDKHAEESKESKSKDANSSFAESTLAPGSSIMTDTTFKHDDDQAKSTAVETEEDQAQVKSRNRQISPTRPIERPATPNSMRSNGKNPKSGSLFKTILHVVFVEWIGGFLMRLCGGRRRRQ